MHESSFRMSGNLIERSILVDEFERVDEFFQSVRTMSML